MLPETTWPVEPLKTLRNHSDNRVPSASDFINLLKLIRQMLMNKTNPASLTQKTERNKYQWEEINR